MVASGTRKLVRLPQVAYALLAFLAAIAFSFSAQAQAFSITTTVDENGNGTLTNTAGFFSTLPFTLQNDPGPGGLPSVLTYSLLNPPGLTAGDVLITEPGGGLSDVVRFNPSEICARDTGCLVFYSDVVDGIDSLADTSFPGALYPNTVTIPEIGPEGANGATYTPTAGQPGFVAGAGGPVTYVLRSDTRVPEPASLALFGVGLAALGLLRHRLRA